MKRPKNTKWYQHEGLDRTHMLICMLEEAFYVDSQDYYHPSLHTKKAKKLARKAGLVLASLYQEIGAWENPKKRKH
jgi:hypothetical protein